MSVLQSFSLQGRKALITGGNRGLGKAFARACAEAGADVAIAARDRERTDQVAAELTAAAPDRTIAAVTADVTDRASVEDMVAQTVDALGGLDILVNNAGLAIHRPSWEIPDEEWHQVFDINVHGVWLASTTASKVMAAAGGGSIVNVGSMSAQIVNRPQWQPAYNASKAAVHHLTKSLAAEWAPHHIRVNALAPGYVKTDMSPVDEPRFRQHWVDDAPLQRYAMPEEIAPSVVYLASDASSFMTGSVLVIDGGYTIW